MVCKDGVDACYLVCEPSPYSIPKTPVFLKMQDCILQMQCLQRCLIFQKKQHKLGVKPSFCSPLSTFSDVQVLRAHVRTTGSETLGVGPASYTSEKSLQWLWCSLQFETYSPKELCTLYGYVYGKTSFKVLETLKGAYTTSTSILLPSSWEVWVSPAPRRL